MSRRPSVAFLASDKPREQELAHAFLAGARHHSWKVAQRRLGDPLDLRGLDAAAMVGVKSKAIFDQIAAAGVVPIMLDKGYVRTRRTGSRVWEYWRVAVGAHHPTRFLMSHKMPADRFAALGLEVAPWRKRGHHILIAGSSAKYHAFYDLKPPNEYYDELVAAIRARTDREIVYRPKPSYRDAVAIDGTVFSGDDETIREALWGAHALVTHGSNACFEAALMGVPSIVLGDAVAAPISTRDLDNIDDPPLCKRDQWLSNLAYFQYTEDEFRAGLAWPLIAGLISSS